MYDDAGEIDQVVSVVRDITEKKSREEELEQSRKSLLRSQKIGKTGDWEFDLSSGHIYWSPMMYEIYERAPNSGPPPLEEIQSVYYGEDTEKHNEHVRKTAKNGEPYDLDLQKSGSMGFTIIHTLIDQLGAELDIESSEQGSSISFSFDKQAANGSASNLVD